MVRRDDGHATGTPSGGRSCGSRLRRMPHRSTPSSRLAAALPALFLGLVAALLGALPAAADGAGVQTLDECLVSGQVWLVVIDDTGTAHSNQCVGEPANGEQALADGGISIGLGKSRFICTLDGYPDSCPSAASGDYWTYFQGTSGGSFTYSDKGAATSTPIKGGIEAWCFTGGDEKRCTPPTIDELEALAVTANAPVAVPAGTPWAVIGVVAVLVVGVGVLVFVKRRGSRHPGGAIGGR